jgi:hypothetical protein
MPWPATAGQGALTLHTDSFICLVMPPKTQPCPRLRPKLPTDSEEDPSISESAKNDRTASASPRTARVGRTVILANQRRLLRRSAYTGYLRLRTAEKKEAYVLAKPFLGFCVRLLMVRLRDASRDGGQCGCNRSQIVGVSDKRSDVGNGI